MKAKFEVRDICVKYGERRILDHVGLEIFEGEFCGLLGLNGSGKTTLLHAICGFIPMQGGCFVNGTDCGKLNERKRAREVALIPQTCSLEGGRTALEVVLMGYNAWLHILESPLREHREKALDIMDKLGCRGLADKDFGQLSLGQRQMVILARCMVQDTPVMLMDEPDSALDFLNKHIVLQKIRNVIQNEGKMGLITMHDPNFAMKYCDRLFLLKDGAILTQIDMRKDPECKIKRDLSTVYGRIELLKNGKEYLMVRGEDA